MKNSTIAAVSFWGYTALLITLETFIPSLYATSWYVPLSTIFFLALILVWVIFDARDENYIVPTWLKIFIVLLGFIFVPVYLIKAKGWKRAFVSLCKFIIIVAALFGYIMFLNLFINQNAV